VRSFVRYGKIKKKRVIGVEPFTFLHAADLHLDSPFKGMQRLPSGIFERVRTSTFTALKRLVNIAIQKQVDAVLLSGDLYDGENRSLKAQLLLREELERLHDNGISVFITHGNHDHLAGKWATISWPENVYFFNQDVEAVPVWKNNKLLAFIYGFSYPQRVVLENMVPRYEKKQENVYHVGMLHGTVDGNKNHEPYAPFTIDDLLRKDFHYWALGHIHKGAILHRSPPIIYSGNIQGRHKNEEGEKGCYLVCLKGYDSDLTFFPTADIVWESDSIDISDIESIDQFLDHMYRRKKQLRFNSEGVCRFLKLTVVGNGALHPYFQDEEKIHELAEMMNDGEENHDNFIWTLALDIKTSNSWDREQLLKESNFISDLLHTVDSYDRFESSLSPLFSHYKGKRFLTSLSDMEKQEILAEAEKLILQELLTDLEE
jgi:exonuclease SbcD